jgi:N-sulfoglucosamine sulfohydrolase
MYISLNKNDPMSLKRLIIPVYIILITLSGACSSQNDRHEAPNILFCIADDQSFPHAGAYGCDWVKTPSFDWVAEQGILFTRAYTPMAKCAPSRSCIVTGRNTWQLEAAANHVCFFPPKFKTYAEALMEKGYFVGHTMKGWGPGVALTSEGEVRQMVGPAFNEHRCDPPTKFISEVDYAANFEAFLDSRIDGQPFCFWAGSIEPHRAYEYRSGVTKGNKQLSDIDKVPGYWPDCDTVRNDMLDYAFEVEYWDGHVGRMLQILEERGLLENTLVIATSDHGMPFPRVKGMPNHIANRVPLAMMWPKGIKEPGRVMEEFISFTDFAPTFLDLAGITFEESGMQEMEGTSLGPLLAGVPGTHGRDIMVFGKERTDVGRPNDVGYPARGISDGAFVYVHNFFPERWPANNPETGYTDTDGSPTKSYILNDRRRKGDSWYWDQNFGKHPADELYDINADPYQINNLAGDPAFESIKESLKAKLFEELTIEGDPRMTGEGDIFDNYLYAAENFRNYYQRFMAGEELYPNWISRSDFETEDPEFKK